ncbi:VWA domain-containing protein [uncultured Pseudoteredinibacter sp.]|uniref:VWA domain-containing protein n=1 Tax=uncultured Pseudoteredinibacter sp. TaxID=1641701 RepID=UPI002607139F|nr:VWA domain-containing protein [uncultured Pseudoteredinibacter sp.]
MISVWEYWQSFHFLRPWALWLLLPAVFLYVMALLQARLASRWGQIIKAEYLDILAVDSRHHSWLSPLMLMLMTCSLAVLVVAGPSWQLKANPLKQTQEAIYLVLQLNEEMQEDEQRLLTAKLKIRSLLQDNKNLPVALMVFSGSAHNVLPLSRDHQAINLYLADLSADLMPEDGYRPDLALQHVQQQLDLRRYPQSTVVVIGNNESLVEVSQFSGFKSELLKIYWSYDAQEVPAFFSELNFEALQMSPGDSDLSHFKWLLKKQQRSLAYGEEDDWQDAGYFLLWPLLILALLWFRRGMVLSWT